MRTIRIRDKSECNVMEIWAPKYNTEHADWEVWLHKRKVDYGAEIIIINFTKAKHLSGQKFAIERNKVQRSQVGSNGKTQVYKLPFGRLATWEEERNTLWNTPSYQTS